MLNRFRWSLDSGTAPLTANNLRLQPETELRGKMV